MIYNMLESVYARPAIAGGAGKCEGRVSGCSENRTVSEAVRDGGECR